MRCRRRSWPRCLTGLAGREACGRGGDELHAWLLDHAGRVSAAPGLARAIRYAIRHWAGLALGGLLLSGLLMLLDDGRVEMNATVVERAIRPSVLTRKNALFAGSDDGARHWAEVAKVLSALADGKRPEGMAMTLIQTAKLNGIEPMAWPSRVNC